MLPDNLNRVSAVSASFQIANQSLGSISTEAATSRRAPFGASSVSFCGALWRGWKERLWFGALSLCRVPSRSVAADGYSACPHGADRHFLPSDKETVR